MSNFQTNINCIHWISNRKGNEMSFLIHYQTYALNQQKKSNMKERRRSKEIVWLAFSIMY